MEGRTQLALSLSEGSAQRAPIKGSETRWFGMEFRSPVAPFDDRLWMPSDPPSQESTRLSYRGAYEHGLRSCPAGQLRNVRCQAGVARRSDCRQQPAS